jgi:hypothetical protein
MLSYLPILLFLAGGIVLRFFTSIKPGVQNWLIALSICFGTWLFILVAPIQTNSATLFSNWSPFTISQFHFAFTFDRTTWLLLYCLSSFLFCMIWASLNFSFYLLKREFWGTALIIAGLGALALTANNIPAFIVTWLIVDVENIFLWAKRAEEQKGQEEGKRKFPLVLSTIGVLILVLVLIVDPAAVDPFGSSPFSTTSSILVLIAVVIRALAFSEETGVSQATIDQYYLYSLYQAVALLAGSSIIFRMDLSEFNPIIMMILSVVFYILILYNSVRWFLAADQKKKRKYLIRFFLFTAVFLVLQTDRASAIRWICNYLINIGMITLGGYAFKKKLWLLFMCIFTLSGFPLVPFSLSWLFRTGSIPFTVILSVSLGFIIAGCLRLGRRYEAVTEEMNRWINLISLVGIFVLFAAQWLFLLKIPGGYVNWGVAWASGISMLLGVVLFFGYLVLEKRMNNLKIITTGRLKHAGMVALNFIELNWLSKILNAVVILLSDIVRFIISILEGEAGLIWSLLLLTLLITVIQVSQR